MTTGNEFREYAKECLAWADEAETTYLVYGLLFL